MMRTMRENTKTILWIVVISFVVTIFAVWGMDLRTGSSHHDPNVLGKVNGVPITRAQFQAVYNQMIRTYNPPDQQRELSHSEQEMIREQAWRTLVGGILTRQQIEKWEIGVTNGEIDYYLRNTPPPEVQQYFLDEDGNFDFQAYQAALNNPDVNWASLERLARDRIPKEKLDAFLQAMVHVSQMEIQRYYEESTETLSAAYVEFPLPPESPDFAPSGDQVSTYYREHKEEFKEPVKALVSMVVLPLRASARDTADARQLAQELLERLGQGEDMAELAKNFSDAPTGPAGGETGFIGEGQREPAYFEALAKLEVGGTSGVVATSQGFYVLRLLARENEKYNVREILVRVTPGYDTVDSLQALASDLYATAKDVGLEQAAREKGVELLTPPPFAENMPIEGVGFAPKVSRFAFSAKKGTLSPVLSEGFRYFIVHLKDIIPGQVRPLAEVESAIVAKLSREKRAAIARGRAREFYLAAKSQGFRRAAADQGLKVVELKDFKLADNLEALGPYSPVAVAAFSLPEGNFSPPVESGDSFYVVMLLKRSPFNKEDFAKRINEIRQQLLQEKIRSFVSFWFKKLQEESKVEDYRDAF